MKYLNIRTGRFISRPNRFIAHVDIDGREEVVHVKNTGRCREIFIPGTEVALEESDNPNRKTRFDLVGAKKEGIGWINVDSQAPNKVVKEWLAESLEAKEIFPGVTYIKPEYTFGKSRVDFYMEGEGRKILMEIKGVTLEREKIGYFPDAPTERGVKHLDELTEASKQGYECWIGFVIQMEGVDVVYPNETTHPEFKTAMDRAIEAGAGVIYLGCSVTPEELKIDRVKIYKK
ncbi:MAG: DNA/RNA nuclease SfsA [Clostridiales bacterium]|nr:DNA/RNA nuclease SfsA [Clostridiales bacterium]